MLKDFTLMCCFAFGWSKFLLDVNFFLPPVLQGWYAVFVLFVKQWQVLHRCGHAFRCWRLAMYFKKVVQFSGVQLHTLRLCVYQVRPGNEIGHMVKKLFRHDFGGPGSCFYYFATKVSKDVTTFLLFQRRFYQDTTYACSSSVDFFHLIAKVRTLIADESLISLPGVLFCGRRSCHRSVFAPPLPSFCILVAPSHDGEVVLNPLMANRPKYSWFPCIR